MGLKCDTQFNMCFSVQYNNLGVRKIRNVLLTFLIALTLAVPLRTVAARLRFSHVRLSAFISLNPLFFIPSAVTQLTIGCRHRGAASAPRSLPLSAFVLISGILTDSAAPQMFNSLKRRSAFVRSFQGGAVHGLFGSWHGSTRGPRRFSQPWGPGGGAKRSAEKHCDKQQATSLGDAVRGHKV